MAEMIAYDKRELSAIMRAFKVMDDEAIAQAKESSSALADFASREIRSAGYGRTKNSEGVRRIVDGVKVSKTSKVGELSYGFANQKFSGGGTTRKLWAGLEFGSNRYKQFPQYSGRQGRGSRGWFIYPTLRRIQPDIVKKWEESFSKILNKWDD
jgi:hypothetical protein